LTIAPMAPEPTTVFEMTDRQNRAISPIFEEPVEDGWSSAMTERPRKYSEGYREVEAVDGLSLRGYHFTCAGTGDASVSREKADLLGDSSHQNCQATSNPTRQENCHVSCREDHDNDFNTLPLSMPLTKRNLRPTESMLEKLPVAEAIAEIPVVDGTTQCGMSSVDAVATQVVRLNATSSTLVRASLICVKVFKASKSTKLGIRLQLSKEGHLQLGSLNGLLEESPLRPGDEVLRLNGQNVMAWTTSKALNYIRDSWGWISIVVRNTRNGNSGLYQTSILKNSFEDRLGVTFERRRYDNKGYGKECENRLYIRKLNVAGLLGCRSTVRVGDSIESINHIPCAHVDDTTAVSIIRNAPDWVHLLVRPKQEVDVDEDQASCSIVDCELREISNVPSVAVEAAQSMDIDNRGENAEPAIVSVALLKANKKEQIGLTAVRVENTLYIKRLDGQLGNSILKEGMSILAINQRLASRMTVSDLNKFVRDTVGEIHILARNPDGDPGIVQAMTYCKSKLPASTPERSFVGVSFRGAAGRQLEVCDIRKNGLFVQSCLNVGDSILQINGIPCQQSRPKDAVALVRASEESVTILAKAKVKTAIVVAQLATKKHGALDSPWLVTSG